MSYVVTDQLEVCAAEQVFDVMFGAGEKIIETYDFKSFAYQKIAKMRANKSCATSNQNPPYFT